MAGAWVTSRVLRDATRQLRVDLPARYQGLVAAGDGILAPTPSPWRSAGLLDKRIRAERALAESVRDRALYEHARFAAGQLNLEEFRAALRELGDRFLVQNAALGLGQEDIRVSADLLTRLDRMRGSLHGRLDALLDSHAAGEKTANQLGAHVAQRLRGHAHAAAQAGGAAWLEAEPVRWVMRDGADHCETCPDLARTYASLDELLSAAGGWPGEADTDCHGNCQCTVEAASVYSVYRDTNDLLVTRGGVAGLPVEALPLRRAA